MKSKLILLVVALFLIAACTSDDDKDESTPVYTVISEGTLSSGTPIPTPSEDTIVTITGKIGTTNVGDAIEMDLKTVESVGLVDYTVTDPFENKKITYRGPLMTDLLALWGVPEDATTLHMVALNDYAVDVPLSDLRKYPVIFALQADGVYLPVSTRGPAMLVYPYDHFEFEPAVYNDYWIWQIKSIEVR
jgi:hypothetical protein